MMGDEVPNHSLELADYVRVLRRRWLLVVVLAVLGIGAGALYSQARPSVYDSTAAVLVKPVNVDPSQSPIRPDQLVSTPTEREVLRSSSVISRALAAADVDLDVRTVQRNLSVSALEGTQVLVVTYRDRDPIRAQQVTQSVVQEYLRQRRAGAAERVDGRIGQFVDQVAEAESALESTNRTVTSASPDTAEQLQAISRRDYLLGQIQQLQGEIASLAGLSVEPGEIISAATLPESATGMSELVILLVGLAAGVLCGVPLAFVVHRLDDRVYDASETELCLGVPVLAGVPRWSKIRTKKSSVLERPDDLVAESFRRLRNNVLALVEPRGWSSLLITSALPREGKSEVAVNLAVAMARSGVTVLLVSADLRRPTLHSTLNLPLSPGLSDVLERELNLTEVMWTIPDLARLRVVTAGVPNRDPGDLLRSPHLAESLAAVKDAFDVLIFDAPPVLAVSECVTLASRADAVLLTVRSGRTRARDLRAASRGLQHGATAIAGAVLVGRVGRAQARGYSTYHGPVGDAARGTEAAGGVRSWMRGQRNVGTVARTVAIPNGEGSARATPGLAADRGYKPPADQG